MTRIKDQSSWRRVVITGSEPEAGGGKGSAKWPPDPLPSGVSWCKVAGGGAAPGLISLTLGTSAKLQESKTL